MSTGQLDIAIDHLDEESADFDFVFKTPLV